MRRALREAGLGVQVQQRKPILSCNHVLAHQRFAQRLEKLIIDDWKCMINETKINRSSSNGRSWCWIGDGERVGPQHV